MKKLLFLFVLIPFLAKAQTNPIDLVVQGSTIQIWSGGQAISQYAGVQAVKKNLADSSILVEGPWLQLPLLFKNVDSASFNGGPLMPPYSYDSLFTLFAASLAPGGNYMTTTGDVGAKTASFAGIPQTNAAAKGATITVLCGTVSGITPTLSAQLQFSPDGGTTWLNIGSASGNATATGNSLTFQVYPNNTSTAGATPGALTTGSTQTVQLNAVLPRTWRLNYTIGGTTPSFAITGVYVNYQL